MCEWAVAFGEGIVRTFECGDPSCSTMVPFSERENKYRIKNDEVEPFRAVCACPGCGDVCAHLMREPTDWEPDEATTIRICETCKREWAQQ